MMVQSSAYGRKGAGRRRHVGKAPDINLGNGRKEKRSQHKMLPVPAAKMLQGWRFLWRVAYGAAVACVNIGDVMRALSWRWCALFRLPVKREAVVLQSGSVRFGRMSMIEAEEVVVGCD